MNISNKLLSQFNKTQATKTALSSWCLSKFNNKNNNKISLTSLRPLFCTNTKTTNSKNNKINLVSGKVHFTSIRFIQFTSLLIKRPSRKIFSNRIQKNTT
jgi:hypothetical protein